ncbi:MAG: hypothetical protein OXE78_11750 [Gammaproteobacteria bacterium]|nr:hypothetical protein [Gammaproteobacteria bacterium]MCY4357108.1 hypothetical protein [Gammaproteobacteria bacterium]
MSDRWILSQLQTAVKVLTDAMDNYRFDLISPGTARIYLQRVLRLVCGALQDYFVTCRE